MSITVKVLRQALYYDNDGDDQMVNLMILMALAVVMLMVMEMVIFMMVEVVMVVELVVVVVERIL